MKALVTNLKEWRQYETQDGEDCQSLEEHLVYNLASDTKAPVTQNGITVTPLRTVDLTQRVKKGGK